MSRSLVLAAISGVAVLSLTGCAGTSGWEFAKDPGVPADIRTSLGERIGGSLVGLSDGALIVETEIERGERVEVIRKQGMDYVYVDGVAVGTAVQVRDFDIVTRQRVPLAAAERMVIKTRTYFGWGSAIAGALAFFLVQLLEET